MTKTLNFQEVLSILYKTTPVHYCASGHLYKGAEQVQLYFLNIQTTQGSFHVFFVFSVK